MLDFVLGKIAAVPWYFWSLVWVWGAIETAGWLRMRNSQKRPVVRSSGGRLAGMGAWFTRWGLRRRVY